MNFYKYFLTVFIVLTGTTACDSVDMESLNATAKSMENEHALHAGSSEKLRIIMRDIHSSAYKDEAEIFLKEKLSEEEMADLIEAVEELLFHAELLTMGKPEVDLDENELVTFRAMASQLYTEALNIKQLTEYYDYHLLEPAYERLNQTCVACHSLFRGKNTIPD